MENWMSKIFSYVHRNRKHWECKYCLISYKLTIHLWNSSIYLTFTASCRINPIRCALSDHSVQTIKPWFLHISGRTSRGYIYPLSYLHDIPGSCSPGNRYAQLTTEELGLREYKRSIDYFAASPSHARICTLYPVITDMPFINYLHWLQWKLRASTVPLLESHCIAVLQHIQIKFKKGE